MASLKTHNRLNCVFVGAFAACFVYLLSSTIVSCGGSSSSTSTPIVPPLVSVSISPTLVSLTTGGTEQFAATVSGMTNTAVTWSTTGGTISSTGLYTAPSTAGMYSVTVTSQADSTKAATAIVTVSAPASGSVSISPTSVSLTTGGTQQFAATVSGMTNTAVTWSTTGGTISSTGLYTAPSTAGMYSVTVTSQADSTKAATAIVTVSAPVGSLSLVVAGHTTSSNFPVTNGSTYQPGTVESGIVSVLTIGSRSTALTFSTYLGKATTQIYDAWIDPSGNIYVAGLTSDTAFPTTSSVFQPAYGGGPDDAFIAKYSPTGTLLWATYIGTSGTQIEETVHGIAGYDLSGNLAICGRMNSASSIAGVTINKYGPSTAGTTHVFAAKIKPDGSGIVWFTMLGGSSGDGNRGRCVIDAAGNVYGEGETASTDFPTTSGAYQTTNRSTSSPPIQGIVYKLSSTGSLVWSTYIGGSGNTNGGDATNGGIALDSSGNLFIAGYTYSTNLGATVGAYQTALPDASLNGSSCYIGKLKGDGTAMLALTYLGGSVLNNSGGPTFSECMGLNLDSSGNVVVQGIVPYKNFPTTAGVYQPIFGGGNYDGFVSKLSSDLTTLIASTFIGGSGNDIGDSSARVEFDANRNIYTGLTTNSTNFPTTSDAYQNSYLGGTEDEVVFGLSPDLKTLVYSTYLGGNGADFNRSFRLK